MSLTLLKKILRSHASRQRQKLNERYFKTGRGQYGYGDKFIGVANPDCRAVAQEFGYLPLATNIKLLQSKIHEERSTALFMLVNKFAQGDDLVKKRIYKLYLDNFQYVNNWDLVDQSAHKIVGAYLLTNPKDAVMLAQYANSKNLWARRLAIVATLAFIKNNEFSWTMKIARLLLADEHNLIQKATGWMLREVWKLDHKIVENFLTQYYRSISRTTLRYAIERMGERKRQKFLFGNIINIKKERVEWIKTQLNSRLGHG